MSVPLRVLMLEDRAADAELLLHELSQAGFEPIWKRVETESDYLAALDPSLDVILSDYSLPQFDGLRAAQLLRERGLDIPFILVSGTIGEDFAVEAMKHGATDYLLKDRLARLGAAITHVLAQKELRAEKRQADQALRDSEKRFRALIEKSSDGISLLGVDGKIVYASPATQRILGITPEEAIGIDPRDYTHPDDLGPFLTLLNDLLQKPGSSFTTQYRFRNKEGSWRWLESTVSNLLAESWVNAIVFNYRDITERKRAEEALRVADRRAIQEYERLLERLSRLAQSVGTARDLTTVYRSLREFAEASVPCNGLFVSLYDPHRRQRMCVYSGGDGEEDDVSTFPALPMNDSPQSRAIATGQVVVTDDFQTAVAGKPVVNLGIEHDPRLPQSSLAVPLTVLGRVIGAFEVQSVERAAYKPEHVTAMRMAANLAAIATENVQMLERERQLRIGAELSEERYRTLAEAAQDAIFIINRDDRVEYVNSFAASQFGGRPDELIGKTRAALFPPHVAEHQARSLQQVFENGNSAYSEMKTVYPTGEIWVGTRLAPIRNAAGEVRAVLGIARDITERKRAEEALRASEASLREAQRIAHLGSWERDLESDQLWGSDEVYRIIGLGRQEFAGTSAAFTQLVHPGDQALLNQLVRTVVRERKPLNMDFRLLRPDGEQRHIAVVVEPEFDQSGKAKRLLGTLQDITQRKRADEERARLVAILEATPDFVAIAHAQGQALYLNAAGQKMLGVTPDVDVATLTIGESHPAWAREIVLHEAIPTAIRDGAWRGETALLSRDGREIPVSQVFIAHKTPDGETQYLSTIARDITERKRAEERLIALNDLGRALADTLALSEIYERFYSAIVRLLPDSVTVFISLFDPERELITCAYGVHDGQRLDPTTLPPIPLEPAGAGTQSEAIHTRRPLIVNDLNARLAQVNTRVTIGTPGPTTQSGLYVPMLSKGQVIGVVQLQSHAPDRYSQADAELLSLVANTAAVAIQNVRLFEEAQVRAEQLALLYDAGLALNSVLEPRAQLDLLFKMAVKALRADRAEFFRYDAAQDDSRLEQSIGYADKGEAEQALRARGFRNGDARGLVGWVSKHRLPLNVPDVSADPRYIAMDPAIRSGLWVPVEHENQLRGVLAMLSTRVSAFTPQDERLIALFANQVAVAMENARLFEETSRRLGQVQSLHTIDVAISSSLDLQVTFDVFLEQVTARLGVHAADILLLNPHTQILEFTAGRGFRSKSIERTHLRLGECFAGRAALERRIVNTPNLAEAKDIFTRAALLAGEAFVSYYAVPLMAKGLVKGVLEIFHRAPLEPDHEWLDFLETLAGQAAIAIDNTTLFNDLQRSNVELTLAYDTTIEGWSRALDLRDKETEGHTQRVTEITVRLARAMGLGEDELVHIRRGALLHDIGKMGVPDAILLKPGKLSDEEWELMRKHPVYAYEMLAPIGYLRPALDIPYCHHEQWDGAGYPRGLTGEQIPLAARIFAVVDVWDALRSDRPYRKAWTQEQVREHIRAGAGSHFDPKVVEAFLRILDEKRV